MSHSHIPLTTVLAVMAPALALANNIQVSNVTLTGQNTANDTYQVQFDVSWANSWRTSTAEANYDAAWIFIKFKAGFSQIWQHATLSSTGHVAAVGSVLQPPADLKGAFIFKSANGIGNVNYTGVQLQWNYGASGIGDNDLIEVRVLAIEMVFIPQGAFVVGDGTSTGIERQFEAGNTGAPLVIGSESAITLGGTAATNLSNHNNVSSGIGISLNDDFNYTTTQALPLAFPKGFNAFYVMKYECTEGQYVDLLNMLTATQAAARFPNQTGISGHTIDDTGTAPDIYVTTAPERACSFLDGLDVLAYADWAALRPMSELEYEKVCRGNLVAVVNEYAWGSTSVRSTAYTLSNAGTASESLNALGTQGNANYGLTNGGAGINFRSWRSGIFAGSLTTPSRAAAGAGYYGAMELSGSLTELVITVGQASARTFNGSNGDGSLSATGAANVAGWPASGSVIDWRGGGWNISNPNQLRISDREVVNVSILELGGGDTGARLCRLP